MTNLIEMDSTEARCDWAYAEPWLRRAIYGADPEGYLRNVQAKVFAGLNTLWKVEGEEGATVAYAVTSLYTSDGITKIAQIHLTTAENLEEAMPYLEYFEVWAKKHGASWVEVIGRKGWERRLRPYGFNHEYTSLLKRVMQEIH